MKRAVALLVVLGVIGCRAPAPGGTQTGADRPRRAVELFLAAVNAQDIQQMSVVWGTEKGPARDQLPRQELERREIIMQQCFAHDRYRVIDEVPGEGGVRMLRVEITRGGVSRTPQFQTIKGPSERWYVLDADVAAMRDLCRPS
ncbi:MAG TPA: hypothetical protein VJ717_03015 [Gemmatimonadaceae bacterium]|nr:hypothetical protein [Gemmatimonadaceae bacterium]